MEDGVKNFLARSRIQIAVPQRPAILQILQRHGHEFSHGGIRKSGQTHGLLEKMSGAFQFIQQPTMLRQVGGINFFGERLFLHGHRAATDIAQSSICTLK